MKNKICPIYRGTTPGCPFDYTDIECSDCLWLKRAEEYKKKGFDYVIVEGIDWIGKSPTPEAFSPRKKWADAFAQVLRKTLKKLKVLERQKTRSTTDNVFKRIKSERGVR